MPLQQNLSLILVRWQLQAPGHGLPHPAPGTLCSQLNAAQVVWGLGLGYSLSHGCDRAPPGCTSHHTPGPPYWGGRDGGSDPFKAIFRAETSHRDISVHLGH